MLDAKLRPLIDPPLNAIGRALAKAGITANAITFAGLALGLGGAAAIALGHIGWGLALILANRLLDGLDGSDRLLRRNILDRWRRPVHAVRGWHVPGRRRQERV